MAQLFPSIQHVTILCKIHFFWLYLTIQIPMLKHFKPNSSSSPIWLWYEEIVCWKLGSSNYQHIELCSTSWISINEASRLHFTGFNRMELWTLTSCCDFQSQNSTRKLDRGLCLSRTKTCADYDSRGFEPATPVAGPATLRYWATQDA